jgi:DNA-binding MarR family transcriptional regulator
MDPAVEAMAELIDEVRALFHVLKAAAERVHDEGESSAARRGVLLGLHKNGPQTVPQIARSRPVSRQHIQVVVNGLLDDGLVELMPNPAHKRSHLVALTLDGRTRVRAVAAREAAILRGLETKPAAADLLGAARTLAAVRSAFSEPALEEAIERSVPAHR